MVVIALCCSLDFLTVGGSKGLVAGRGHAHNTRRRTQFFPEHVSEVRNCFPALITCPSAITLLTQHSCVLLSFCSHCSFQNVGCQKSTARLSASGICQCFASWMRWSCSSGRRRERSYRGADPGIPHTSCLRNLEPKLVKCHCLILVGMS